MFLETAKPRAHVYARGLFGNVGSGSVLSNTEQPRRRGVIYPFSGASDPGETCRARITDFGHQRLLLFGKFGAVQARKEHITLDIEIWKKPEYSLIRA